MQHSDGRKDSPPSSPAPFGLDLSMTVFDRATRIARGLFERAGASIILIHEGQVWRSHHADALPVDDPVTQAVIASGQLFWVDDGQRDPRFAHNPLVTGPPYLRFCASVPIRLQDGSIPGVLSISGLTPQAYDPAKAGRLKDLADFVADEWSRAHAARALAQSIRERDAALERSARSEERLNLALSLADIHVWEMDYDRRELTKAGAEDAFHIKPRTYEELYRDIYATVDPRDRAAVEAAWTDHIENGVPYRPEYRMPRADGGEVWVQSVVKHFADDAGRMTRMVGALQNITDRKRTERALIRAKQDADAANQAKSAFLATMSHEIRTPLNGVLGMAQAMAGGPLNDDQRERLDVVRQSGEALLTILNDILDLSKIEAGKIDLEMIDFDLGEIAASTQANFADIAREKGLTFVLDIEAAGGAYRGDPTRLRQILGNLISNALKFTEAGEVRVAAAYADKHLTLTVSDSGMGLSQTALSSLFDKFTQADSSTTRRFGGTGLGLAICRELAERMGGSITAKSEIGQGSTFTVVLPLGRVAAPADHAATRPAAGPASFSAERPLRILAAEDNAINQKVLQTLLMQAGLDLVVVGNGAEAVTAWRDQPWDIVLMDVQMPVMDGPTATATIREIEASERRSPTPIIGLTANAMSHQIDEYRACGMDEVVTKPIQINQLFEALRTVLNAGPADRAAVA